MIAIRDASIYRDFPVEVASPPRAAFDGSGNRNQRVRIDAIQCDAEYHPLLASGVEGNQHAVLDIAMEHLEPQTLVEIVRLGVHRYGRAGPYRLITSREVLEHQPIESNATLQSIPEHRMPTR